MNKKDVLSVARRELIDAISKTVPAIPDPLNVSPWIAMSLLQKAIRRGRNDLALRAAATLLRDSPERFWRRCGCIVFEDVGMANAEAVPLATVALTGKKFRAAFGGEWSVANFIVSAMVSSPKCRAADDLLLTAEQHPAYQTERREFASLGTRELFEVTIGPAPLPIRALALWYAIGTDRRPSPRLRNRKGEPQAVFDLLCEAGYPHTLVEIAREGFRKTREVLCPFVVLLSEQGHSGASKFTDDEMPPEIAVQGVPSWAYDLYSREGKRAFEVFLEGSCETARWVREHAPPSQRVHILGTAVFRIEGGLVKQRLRWPLGDELRRQVDVECHGLKSGEAVELLHLLQADLPILNRIRANVMGVGRHAG